MKHGTLRKVLSLIMAIAMVLTLLPVGALAADDTITVYFRNDWLWPEVYVHYWNDSQGTTWPGEKMTFVETLDEGGVYSAEIPTWADTIIFNGLENGNASNRQQTPNVTGFADGSAYYIHWDEENKCSTFTYTPSTGDGGDSGEVAEPVEPVDNVTIHYRNTGLWESVCGYAWTEGETDAQDAPISDWPGTVLTEETDHPNWYTLTLTDQNAANGIGVIFNNNNNGSQTGDIAITKSGKYWYDNGLLTEEPATWADGTVKTVECNFTLHFADTMGWGNVYLYTWSAIGTQIGSWPGSKAGLDNDGFYTYSFTAKVPEGVDLNFIFNNGGNGAQTVDLAIPGSEIVENGTVEKWVVPTSENTDDGDENTAKFFCDIETSADAVAISPVVNGTSVTFEYKNADASSVEVYGSMNSWASGYSMTKNEQGVWSATIEDVTPATHRYKFVVDGNWILDPINGWTYNETDGSTNSAFIILDPNAEDTNKITVKFHYSRADGNYSGWNLWVWTQSGITDQYDFEDVNGEKVTSVTVDGRATQYISFIPRYSTEENKWASQEYGERRVDLSDVVSGTIDVYVTSGQYNCMRVLNTDVVQENKISSVELDYDNDKVVITTNKMVSFDDPMDAFKIVNAVDSSDDIAIASVAESGSTYTLTLSKPMDLVNLYKYRINFLDQKAHIDYNYTIGINTVYASAKFGDDFTYEGDDLGATWSASSTTFRVWAPTAEKVVINLYTSGTAGTADLIKTVDMSKDVNGTWVATVEGDLNKTYYTYSVTRDGETVEAVDPYARTTGVNGKRGMVIDLDSTDPEDWANDTDPNPLKSYTDAIIYELHVRDFSIDDSSGVKDKWQGKFLALTQTGTKTENGTTTGLDYLKNLGITHLHLLPVYDYASVDETTCSTFNWGYDPLNYNVPEGSYSTDPDNGEVRVEEFKEMVSTLHDNDISVIMDVVYNHVYDAGAFSMNQIVPGYFSRQNADGSYSNGSGCGNDTASEREMVRKYIVDSVNYWADEYHVDGFRFDLVGLLDATTINEIVDTVHVNHPGALFYGEGWTLGTAVEPGNTMATQANSSATPEFAYFSDTMRNLLGGQNGTSVGFVSGQTGQEEAVAKNFMARPWWTSNPTQIIQYASCHDNYTLVDKLILSTGRNEIDDEVIKMNNLAAAIYMTSQGIPFIHAGEEFLREKLEEDGGRCENSYNASDYVNHIEWSKLENETYANNSAYYKGLIEFRKAHPALRFATTQEITDNVKYTWVTNEVVMFTIDGTSLANETAETIVVIFNANSSAKSVTLPDGTWNVCINGTASGTKAITTATGSVSVDGISAMVLTQDKINVQGANIKLAETLEMSFYVNKADLVAGESYYAEITRDSENEAEDATIRIKSSEWTDYDDTRMRFSYTGLPARAMTDDLTVTIYKEDGTMVSAVWNDSIQDYAMRMLEKNAGDTYLQTTLVDMLNYGAAAQTYFGYNTDDLANANLGEYAEFATSAPGYPTEDTAAVKIEGDYVGTTISLKNAMMLTMYFDGLRDLGNLTATATMTDHYGKEETLKAEFYYPENSELVGVDITGFAVADGMQSITCAVYDTNGKEIATATDSIANYLSRMQDQDDVYAAVMKFVSSANAYFENPNK